MQQEGTPVFLRYHQGSVRGVAFSPRVSRWLCYLHLQMFGEVKHYQVSSCLVFDWAHLLVRLLITGQVPLLFGGLRWQGQPLFSPADGAPHVLPGETGSRPPMCYLAHTPVIPYLGSLLI